MRATQLLDINEVSRRLKVKPATLYAWAAKGKIPCTRLNGLIRFEEAALDRWLDAQRLREQSARASDGQAGPARGDIDSLIAEARREIYTRRRGETRPKSGPVRKEVRDGAV